MARGQLRERYVQRVATAWVAGQYEGRDGVAGVATRLEAVVRPDSPHGRGRADGLVVVQHQDGTIWTIAIEAKSSRTLVNLSASLDDDPWLLRGCGAGLVGAIVGGVIGWAIAGWLLATLFAVVGFVALGLGYLKLTENHQHYRFADAVTQVRRYPANERWVAISTDAYNRLGRRLQATGANLQDRVREQCRRDRIGLLRVSSGEQVVVVEEARPAATPRPLPDYLGCYVRGEQLRQTLREGRREQAAVQEAASQSQGVE